MVVGRHEAVAAAGAHDPRLRVVGQRLVLDTLEHGVGRDAGRGRIGSGAHRRLLGVGGHAGRRRLRVGRVGHHSALKEMEWFVLLL